MKYTGIPAWVQRLAGLKDERNMAKLRVMRFTEETHTERAARLRELARYVAADSATMLLRLRDEEHVWCAGGIGQSGDSVAELLVDRDGGSIIPVCFRLDYDLAVRSYWRPSWLVEMRNEHLSYYGNVPHGELGEEHDFEHSEPTSLEVEAFPMQHWHSAVAKIQEYITKGKLDKAVLSRQISLFSSEPWQVENVIARLLEQSTGTSVYAHKLHDEAIWLGATPEVLFHREGRKILVDSLAGTRQTILEDNSFTTKDKAEQSVVTEFLRSSLEPLCVHVSVSPLTERRADDLEHVYCQVQGVLRDDVNDDDILAVLHPTPAVCGSPRDFAAELLDELEPAPRDLYSGVLGFSNGHQTTAIVVLRCAQVKGRKARLYGGAGIVADSHAELEYSECGWKMEIMRRALLDLL